MEDLELATLEAGSGIDIDDTQNGIPSYDDLVEIGFSEQASQEILENYPEQVQDIYDAMKNADLSETNALEILNDLGIDLKCFYTGDLSTDSSTTDHTTVESKVNGYPCSSQCKYNTGYTYNYANYGYAD